MSLGDVVDQVAQDHLDGVRVKAEFVSARCPFHGEDRHPSFWISRGSGEWGCFACSERGHGLEELLHKMGLRVRGIKHVLDEAKKDRQKTAAIAKLQKKKKAKASFTGEHVLPESLLGLWDMCPVQLLDAGFTQEVLRDHDVGFDEQRARITFPIRDVEGNLVGISGRSTDGSWPKYKVYQGFHDQVREDGTVTRAPGELGKWFPSYSSTSIRDHLYRGHVVYPRLFDGEDELQPLIIVEGYKACLWLVQLGWTNTVALMGARMSKMQERLIRRMGAPTYIMLDNNDAGHSGADQIEQLLGRCTFPVRRCWYADGADEETQPDDLPKEEIDAMLLSSSRAVSRGPRTRRWQ